MPCGALEALVQTRLIFLLSVPLKHLRVFHHVSLHFRQEAGKSHDLCTSPARAHVPQETARGRAPVLTGCQHERAVFFAARRADKNPISEVRASSLVLVSFYFTYSAPVLPLIGRASLKAWECFLFSKPQASSLLRVCVVDWIAQCYKRVYKYSSSTSKWLCSQMFFGTSEHDIYAHVSEYELPKPAIWAQHSLLPSALKGAICVPVCSLIL